MALVQYDLNNKNVDYSLVEQSAFLSQMLLYKDAVKYINMQ